MERGLMDAEVTEDDLQPVSLSPAVLTGLGAFLAGGLIVLAGAWWFLAPAEVAAFDFPGAIESSEAANAVFRRWLASTNGQATKTTMDPELLEQETIDFGRHVWLIQCVDRIRSQKRYFFVSPEAVEQVTEGSLPVLFRYRYTTNRADRILDELIPMALELVNPGAKVISSPADIPNHNQRVQGRSFVGQLDEDLVPVIRPVWHRQHPQLQIRYYVAYAWWPVNGEVLRLRMVFSGDSSDPDPSEGWRLVEVECRSIASRIGGTPGMQAGPPM